MTEKQAHRHAHTAAKAAAKRPQTQKTHTHTHTHTHKMNKKEHRKKQSENYTALLYVNETPMNFYLYLSPDINQPTFTFQKPLARTGVWIAGPTTSPSSFVPSPAWSSLFLFLSSSHIQTLKHSTACICVFIRASLVAQMVKNPPAMWNTWV